jgi:hypothetical protein
MRLRIVFCVLIINPDDGKLARSGARWAKVNIIVSTVRIRGRNRSSSESDTTSKRGFRHGEGRKGWWERLNYKYGVAMRTASTVSGHIASFLNSRAHP